jgi:hypothetical protein
MSLLDKAGSRPVEMGDEKPKGYRAKRRGGDLYEIDSDNTYWLVSSYL